MVTSRPAGSGRDLDSTCTSRDTGLRLAGGAPAACNVASMLALALAHVMAGTCCSCAPTPEQIFRSHVPLGAPDIRVVDCSYSALEMADGILRCHLELGEEDAALAVEQFYRVLDLELPSSSGCSQRPLQSGGHLKVCGRGSVIFFEKFMI